MPTSLFAAGNTDYISRLNELANASFALSLQALDFSIAKGYIFGATADNLIGTFPPVWAPGDRFRTAAASPSVSALTLSRNGHNIDGVGADLLLTGSDSAVNVEGIYIDSTIGVRILRTGSGGMTFEVKSTGPWTAKKNYGYLVKANALTSNLPASPLPGDCVRYVASDYNFSTLTIGRNGKPIRGAAADHVVNMYNFDVWAIYVDATYGWQIVYARRDCVKAPTISAGTLVLDLDRGLVNTFNVALNANITTLTISNPPASGDPWGFELILTADGTLRTLAWGASVLWPFGSAPALTSTNLKKDRYWFETIDGANFFASVIGQSY